MNATTTTTSNRILIETGMSEDAPRPEVSHFESFDGARLLYRAWIPSAAHATKAVILLHRGHEHSGRWQDFVDHLDLGDDVAIFAYDARGHGQSPGERGWAPSFQTFVRDADAFVRFVSREHGIAVQDTAVVAHSVGAVVAATWVHDYAPPIRALVLATPALDVKLYVPFAIAGLRLLNRVKPKSFISSYVKPSMLTHDPEQQRGYREDALISKQIATNVLLDLHDTSKRLVKDAGAIRTPTLVLSAGSDWVVKNAAVRRFYERLSSHHKALHVLDGFSHAIFHEAKREVPAALVRKFLVDEFAGAPRDVCVDERAYSKQVFTKLAKPQAALCPKQLMFRVNRAFLKTVGRLSYGISLGWATGFSSGRSLDHVYGNVARGITPLGKLIDRVFLNAIGWRMIRVRKQHMQSIVRRAIAEQAVRHPGRPVRVLDVAAGPGRYLIETIREIDSPVNVVLRDRNVDALEHAKRLAVEAGVGDRVSVEAGDAFDRASLARVSPAPDVAIVSGLYELFPSNGPVLASLRGLADAMRPGATLIYTNQPWHPQLEFIARVLVHGDGSPWVMRCRSQEEMDDLVRSARFEKVDQLIDENGMFSVSIARKV